MRNIPPQQLKTQVELFISGQKLVNKDFLSKSDPVCVVSQNVNDMWSEIGTTEMIKDDLNPVFKKSIIVDYRFEEQQPLLFELFDIDQPHFKGKVDRRKDESLGTLKIQLAEIVGSKGNTVKRSLRLKGKKNAGWIIIRAEECSQNSNDTLKIRFYGKKLKRMDLFGKSDPYFILSKYSGNGKQQTFKSEIIKNTLNPSWKMFTTSLQRMASGEYNKKLRFDCFDWNRHSKDDYIGSFDFTLNDLKNKKMFQLRVPKKNKTRGDIYSEMEVIPNYSFFEFLSGGLEVSLLVAVDFTGSNGNPNQPGTLHYHQQGVMNEYESAIRSIGDILGHYDSDNMFPVFGFGAQLPNGNVSHCFALNGNAQNPDVHGVDGILMAYHQALKSVRLYGPTYFSEVISVATSYAASSNVCQDVQKYFILLIITDGIINDMQKTIDAIVGASYHPLSIIIVGVGNANFDAMDQLDCDDGLLRSSNGKYARFDIVQFVPFSKYKMNYQMLAKETLAEVPDQVKSYFQWRRIKPNPKPKPVIEATTGNWSFLKKGVMQNVPPQQDPNWQFLKQNASTPNPSGLINPNNLQQPPTFIPENPNQSQDPNQSQNGFNLAFDV